jgi:hypothetical protein
MPANALLIGLAFAGAAPPGTCDAGRGASATAATGVALIGSVPANR